MIKNKHDYKAYLKADKESLGFRRRIPRPIVDDIWKFQLILRKLEYYSNCKTNLLCKIYTYYLKLRFHKISQKLGFEIPINVAGPGLSIAHRGPIVINSGTRIGQNCRIHSGVNIGTSMDTSTTLVPKIGDNCYLGPGCKIYGKITIGDNVAIGANSVVNKSFNSNMTVAGVPAKKVSNKGTDNLLFKRSLI